MKNKQGLTEQEYLSKYKPQDYEKPSVTVDMLIFTIHYEGEEPELELLLIKRGNHPFMGCLALPGGFVDINESIDQAAKRELQEETGLTDIFMEQLYTFGNLQRDPRMRVISVAYMALISKERVHPIAGDDADDLAWLRVKWDTESSQLILSNQEKKIKISYTFERKSIKNGNINNKQLELKLSEHSTGQLAFDHEFIIAIALERLRNKVEYTDIAFNLVPEMFTLPELQKVYEAILGKKMQKASFRRKLASRIEATGEEKVVKGIIRNAKYYRLKKFDENLSDQDNLW